MKNLNKKLLNFLSKKTKQKINLTTNLISNQILDSMGLIEVVDYIEKDLKLNCPINKINKINFNSINLIIKFLKKYN